MTLLRAGQPYWFLYEGTPGGRLDLEWAESGHVFMTGPAEEIYHGDLSFEFLEHLE